MEYWHVFCKWTTHSEQGWSLVAACFSEMEVCIPDKVLDVWAVVFSSTDKVGTEERIV